MTNKIYQPIINALNYEKSIINEIAVGATQYNISHLFDFSSELSATLIGGTTSLISEISETLSLEVILGADQDLSTELNVIPTLEINFGYGINESIGETLNLSFDSNRYRPIDATLNLTSSIESEFSYLLDFTKNISETISMDKRRTHYVWDGGIILR